MAEQIRKVLDQAETHLRELGAEAFRAGDDDGSASVLDVVSELKRLRLRLDGEPPAEAVATRTPSKSGGSGKRRRRSKATRKKAKKSKYPKFSVRNGSLIRIGWSKKQKAEYQHKVPKEAFDRTVAAMAQVAKSGAGPFTADKIIERTKDSTGSVPSYQAYVVIGLLRDQGCVEQVGREGYMIPQDVASRASHLWSQLTDTNK